MSIKNKEDTKSNAVHFLEKRLGGPLTLGNLLQSIRLGEEMNLEEFARHLHISKSHLCDIEKGRKTVSPRRAAKFARILGYSENKFVTLSLQALIEDAKLNYVIMLKLKKAAQ